jgi:hypothetical protein
LIKVKETVPGTGEITFDYGEVMVDALRSGGIQGLTIGEMKDRLDALNVIEPARKEKEEFVVLSPKQHTATKLAVSQFRFRFVLNAAVEFQEHLEHAPEVEETDVVEE